MHDYKQLSIIFCDNLSKSNNHASMQIKTVVAVLILFVNNIIMASHSNKNKNKKIKINNLTIEKLLGEQPFYSSYIEKPKSRNSSIEELLGEQPLCSRYIEKPKSRNLSIGELLSEKPFYKQPIKKSKRKKLCNLELLQVMMLVFLKDKEHIKNV